jgi:hypothetical protein
MSFSVGCKCNSRLKSAINLKGKMRKASNAKALNNYELNALTHSSITNGN